MEQSASANRKIRVLTIALRGWSPVIDLAGLATLPGLDLLGEASNCDDGLRQALMIGPEVIILPWNASIPGLLRAIVYLGGDRFLSPLVVAVVDPSAPMDHPVLHEGINIIAVDQFNNGLVERLHQLLAVRERGFLNSSAVLSRVDTDPNDT